MPDAGWIANDAVLHLPQYGKWAAGPQKSHAVLLENALLIPRHHALHPMRQPIPIKRTP